MLLVKSEKKSYGIKFPTSIDEITPKYLKQLTDNVSLVDKYAIVALCARTKIFDFVTMINNPKNSDLSITPILAKISDEDAKTIHAEIGSKIFIDRSSLERGNHVSINTGISTNNAANYFKQDSELIKSIYNKDYTGIVIDKKMNNGLVKSNSPEIIIMEFKIVPICDIKGSIKRNVTFIDPFLNKDTDNN